MNETKTTKPSKQFAFLGADKSNQLHEKLSDLLEAAKSGVLPETIEPSKSDLQQQERLVFSYSTLKSSSKKAKKHSKDSNQIKIPLGQLIQLGGFIVAVVNPAKLLFSSPDKDHNTSTCCAI